MTYSHWLGTLKAAMWRYTTHLGISGTSGDQDHNLHALALQRVTFNEVFCIAA